MTANKTETAGLNNVPSERRVEDAAALRAALRRFLRRSESVLRSHALTLEQYELLLLIRTAPEQRTTVRDLQLALDRRQSAVTQLTQRAEDLDLISRHVSPDDARVRYLTLTRRGVSALNAAVNGLGPERSRLLAILHRLER